MRLWNEVKEIEEVKEVKEKQSIKDVVILSIAKDLNSVVNRA
jgi:hypothetical protein